MEFSTITSKGQTTIPAEIRKQLKLNAGDKLQFLVEGDHLLVLPTKNSVKKLRGIIQKPEKPVSIEEMNRSIVDEAASRMTN